MKIFFEKIAIIIGLVILNINLSAQWMDHFENPCSVDTWLDIQQTEDWEMNALEEYNISISHPGELVMMPYTVSWFADYRGPLFYRMAEGDFVLTGGLTVTNRALNNYPGSDFSLGGLMIRNPKTLTNGPAGWVANEEDYVFLSVGYASTGHPSCFQCPPPHFEVKSTTNSKSDLNISSIGSTEVDIRLVRLGEVIFVLYRIPGNDWVVHRRYWRPDMQYEVQAGMVSYTDWNKVSTYSYLFHNSHALNEDLDPDPSSNAFVPFTPDITTRYNYLQMLATSLPPAWIGLNLMNTAQVTDAMILQHYGSSILIPGGSEYPVWIGRENSDWTGAANCLNHVPSPTDSVRIGRCDCGINVCPDVAAGEYVVAGMEIESGGTLTVSAGAVLRVNGLLVNHGQIIVEGVLEINTDALQVRNHGILECREGGVIIVNE